MTTHSALSLLLARVLPSARSQYGYPNMSLALNATGRPILYACSWPAYYQGAGLFNVTEWELLSKYCNYWRNYNDINDDWASVADIVEWWANHQDAIAPIAGPGHWNDPDMVTSSTTEQQSACTRLASPTRSPRACALSPLCVC